MGGAPPRADLCLVTGASGFIGGQVARRLHREGYRVRCLVRATSDTSLLDEIGVELAYGDLTDADSLTSAVKDCRFVLHCGALVSDWATVDEIKQINLMGTKKLVEASVAASVERFVHFSTTDVYGHPGGQQIDENYRPTRFGNWYSETKRASEAEVLRADRATALEAVILRPATVYGPHSTDVVVEMAKAIRAGHMLLINGGRAIAGLSYVENVVDLAVLSLGHDAARGGVFNVTDGLDITWRQFLGDLARGLGCRAPWLSAPYGVAYAVGFTLEHGYRLLRRATGLRTAPLLSRQAVQVLGRDQDFSNRKARELLGWEPRISYPAGLEPTLAWLREQQL